MDFFQVFVLAIVQGLTEFLPVSSSAHLVLFPAFLGWPDQGLAFDVAVHVGTLMAVLAYFREDLVRISVDFVRSVHRGETVGDSRLAWGVIFATIPVGLAGLLISSLQPQLLRSPLVIAWASIVFGILLMLADMVAPRLKSEHELRWRDVIIIGLAQALALIPGTSRSGATITAGLFLGLTRPAAARFSFLLSIPVIVLAGGHEAVAAWRLEVAVDWRALYLGAVIAAVSAYSCIHLFLKLLEKVGMWPFVVYRIMLGGLLLWFFA